LSKKRPLLIYDRRTHLPGNRTEVFLNEWRFLFTWFLLKSSGEIFSHCDAEDYTIKIIPQKMSTKAETVSEMIPEVFVDMNFRLLA
jgi:hypothetical protein